MDGVGRSSGVALPGPPGGRDGSSPQELVRGLSPVHGQSLCKKKPRRPCSEKSDLINFYIVLYAVRTF